MKHWKTVLAALAAAGLLTLLTGLPALRRLGLPVNDLLYQQPSASDGEIVILGIDQPALEVLGPFAEWSREGIAAALERLAEGEERPAAVGLDILFAGESQPEADARLAEAAAACGNVYTATMAEFGNQLVADDTLVGQHLENGIVAFEEAYPALRAVTGQGHINVMMDGDGVLRHHLLELSLPDGRAEPSLALALADAYRAANGETPVTRPPLRGEGFWYLPYTGTPGSIEERSLSELLTGELPASYLANKIVLIGPYAAGLQDSYTSAIDHAQMMYGVEIQANAILALLRGEYVQETAIGVQRLMLFGLLLLAFWGFWRRKVRLSALLWACLCGGWLALCKVLYLAGWVLDVLWVPACVTVLFVACIAANYIRAVLERQAVEKTFKRYVAPEIVGELLREGGEALELGGRLTQIAVLFVDVRGFTTMSESLPPKQVVGILNEYLGLIADCILRNGGTLDKFIGDAAMAFWGAPLAEPDFVMQAARAAMDMAEGAQKLADKLEKEYGRKVSFGIGVHLGDAVVGNIGSRDRMDYTAIGDTVNTASRLESNAPGGTIYISRAVADALGDRIHATSLGSTIPLKGKAEGFEVLTLDAIV